MSNSSDSTNQADELREAKRDIVIELSNAYFETYRYDRPNDSVAQLTAFCRDIAENEVDELIAQAQQQLLRELMEQLPHKFEQDITRTQDGDLMCDTCGSDVFGGICACETVNGIIDQVTALLDQYISNNQGES